MSLFKSKADIVKDERDTLYDECWYERCLRFNSHVRKEEIFLETCKIVKIAYCRCHGIIDDEDMERLAKGEKIELEDKLFAGFRGLLREPIEIMYYTDSDHKDFYLVGDLGFDPMHLPKGMDKDKDRDIGIATIEGHTRKVDQLRTDRRDDFFKYYREFAKLAGLAKSDDKAKKQAAAKEQMKDAMDLTPEVRDSLVNRAINYIQQNGVYSASQVANVIENSRMSLIQDLLILQNLGSFYPKAKMTTEEIYRTVFDILPISPEAREFLLASYLYRYHNGPWPTELGSKPQLAAPTTTEAEKSDDKTQAQTKTQTQAQTALSKKRSAPTPGNQPGSSKTQPTPEQQSAPPRIKVKMKSDQSIPPKSKSQAPATPAPRPQSGGSPKAAPTPEPQTTPRQTAPSPSPRPSAEQVLTPRDFAHTIEVAVNHGFIEAPCDDAILRALDISRASFREWGNKKLYSLETFNVCLQKFGDIIMVKNPDTLQYELHRL